MLFFIYELKVQYKLYMMNEVVLYTLELQSSTSGLHHELSCIKYKENE